MQPVVYLFSKLRGRIQLSLGVSSLNRPSPPAEFACLLNLDSPVSHICPFPEPSADLSMPNGRSPHGRALEHKSCATLGALTSYARICFDSNSSFSCLCLPRARLSSPRQHPRPDRKLGWHPYKTQSQSFNATRPRESGRRVKASIPA